MQDAVAGPDRDSSRRVGVLLHSPAFDLEGLAQALDRGGIERASIREIGRFLPDGPPIVVLVDATLLDSDRELLDQRQHGTVLVAADGAAEQALGDAAAFSLAESRTDESKLRLLRTAYQLAAAQLNASRTERELARTRNELTELHRIGMALMTERDPDRLLDRILDQAKRLTGSDAGSLYLTEKDEEGNARLRFKWSVNDSLPDLPFVEFTLPVSNNSLAGYAAANGEALVLDDAYDIPEDAPYSLNRSFDERIGYRTKSMLVVPMLDHRDEVVGVLQLLNRKRDASARITSEAAADAYVLAYTARELQLVQSLAGQAAVSIENSQLYAQIEHLFESFVKAAVTAIDQRDPTTAGHSIRVATLTTDMAQAVERAGSGTYANVRFTREQIRELRYAAMLHDFGKVGVREEVLVKSKKLPPYLWERVESRFDLIRRTAESEYYRQRAILLNSASAGDTMLRQLEERFQRELRQIDQFQTAVHKANEPSVLPEEAAGILHEIASHTFERPDGRTVPYLAPDELHFLRIPKGSLDEKERVEIESHVEQTYRFLTQIPWTEDLRNLAVIAYGHHEKLNGTGYPRKVRAPDIPIQTRMMTIADIFDALTASDRPYKRALPTDRALSIIEMEAKEGMLDQDLVRVLIDGQVYRNVLEHDWRQL